jgi:uncharacterized glyoxalase superfamily protein PhnB
VIQSLATIQSLSPLLFVQDINRSISFYQDNLGVQLEGKAVASDGKVFFCGLKREGCSLMLQQAEEEDGPAENRGRGVIFYFMCDDAERMHEEFTARGLELKAPTTAHYGMRQVELTDPDGHVLCFQSRVRPA